MQWKNFSTGQSQLQQKFLQSSQNIETIVQIQVAGSPCPGPGSNIHLLLLGVRGKELDVAIHHTNPAKIMQWHVEIPNKSYPRALEWQRP